MQAQGGGRWSIRAEGHAHQMQASVHEDSCSHTHLRTSVANGRLSLLPQQCASPACALPLLRRVYAPLRARSSDVATAKQWAGS